MKFRSSSVSLCAGVLTLASGMGMAASAPLLDCSGLPCVTVKISDHKSVKLGIDTGNANSFFDNDTAKAFGSTPEPIIGSDGKPVPGIAKAKVKSMAIGGAILDDLTVLVGDLKSDRAKGTVPRVDGLLAYTAFKDRTLILDFRNRVISVSDINVGNQAGGTKLTYPTFGNSGPPIVAAYGFAVNGRLMLVQVDTQFTGSLLIYPTSVDKLSLTTLAKTSESRRFPFTDGGINLPQAQAGSETFNGVELVKNPSVYFATPGVHLPDGLFDGTVGVELMKNRIVTFDSHANTFTIQ
jgi:hypothetical protein